MLTARAFAPTIVFTASYFVTTVIAASMYMFPGGAGYLLGIGGVEAGVFEDIGSPIYLALLYLPLVITPLAAFLTIRIAGGYAARIELPPSLRDIDISRSGIIFLLVASAAYCSYGLYSLGALNFGVLDGEKFVEKSIRRENILDDGGFVFFVLAYGVNCILPILALIRFEKSRRAADFVLYLVSFLFFVTVIALTYSKAQILVWAVLAFSALVICRSSLKRMIFVGLISVISFFATGYVIGQVDAPARPIVEQIAAPPANAAHPSAAPPEAAHVELVPAVQVDPVPTITPPSTNLNLLDYASSMTWNALHRMAAGHPYYVHLYKYPAERCGIQGQAVRSLLNLPEAKCILPVKSFAAMYPWVNWVVGQQPAPASLSAYGELGFGWSLAVMVLSGIAMGLLGSVAAWGKGSLYIAFSVASCAFAYYLSQVPFIASFTYPHGLFAFMIPIGILAIVGMSGKIRHRQIDPSKV